MLYTGFSSNAADRQSNSQTRQKNRNLCALANLMLGARLRLTAVMSRRGGHRFALGERIHELLAEWGVLAARQPRQRICGAADARLHGLGVLAAQQLNTIQPA